MHNTQQNPLNIGSKSWYGNYQLNKFTVDKNDINDWVNGITKDPSRYKDCPFKDSPEIKALIEPIVVPYWVNRIIKNIENYEYCPLKKDPYDYKNCPPELKDRPEIQAARFNGWANLITKNPYEYDYCPLKDRPEIKEARFNGWINIITKNPDEFKHCPEDIRDRVNSKLFEIQEKKHKDSTALFMALEEQEDPI